jgi:hypothetical protein
LKRAAKLIFILFIYFRLVQTVDYSHMQEKFDLKLLHYYNDTFGTLIGCLVNLLAIFIIRTQTSKELKYYSQALLQNCFIYFIVCIIILITKEVSL